MKNNNPKIYRSFYWDKKTTELAIRLWKSGETALNISKQIGRGATKSSVMSKIYTLGITKKELKKAKSEGREIKIKIKPAPLRGWTEEEDEKLIRFRAEGVPMRIVKNRFHRHTQKGVESRITQLKLAPLRYTRRWTKAEDAKLKALLGGGSSNREVAEVLGRSKKSIDGRISYSGKFKPRVTPQMKRKFTTLKNKYWVKRHHRALSKRNSLNMWMVYFLTRLGRTGKEIANETDLSQHEVFIYRTKLGISKGSPNESRWKYDRNEIFFLLNEGATEKEICDFYQMHYRTLRKIVKEKKQNETNRAA